MKKDNLDDICIKIKKKYQMSILKFTASPHYDYLPLSAVAAGCANSCEAAVEVAAEYARFELS